ncbi:HlyD family secretion protein [Jannaschia faecimaris]|uniref:HlyD family secretion protein n=1 Tax=Jannaschia faecimaris TaxID=1244108 RepID=A0A1H3TYP6_9RHOB|nr:HlyD family efflux transporter periplasmic adaptor subunit [Jannaschia faecimaris]SDZ55364.1 HlyD family secretion protein [Jannaschia faecimaris]
MSPHAGTRLFWAIPMLLLAAGLAFAFWPRAVQVDLATVEYGPMVTTLSETGRTRIHDVFVVSAPVLGRINRIEIEEGAMVAGGVTVVAEIEPIDPAFLDIRTEAEARAAADAARSALALARSEEEQAKAELDFATSDVVRIRELAARGIVSVRADELAERAFRTAQAALTTARAAVEMRQDQLRAAEARLLGPSEAKATLGSCPCVPIRAPVDGTVLRVLHESAGVVAAGEPLLEIGDPRDLEIVIDFVSSEAVRIEPGQRVIIEGWGGPEALSGEVQRVEPFGFTKVSALGIEEQRVGVVIDITSPAETWTRLGHGFEVEARVVLWEASEVLKVPVTALFREEGAWAVFTIVEGRAQAVEVTVGERTDTEAQIILGLARGDVVVRFPDDRIEDGLRLTPLL